MHKIFLDLVFERKYFFFQELSHLLLHFLHGLPFYQYSLGKIDIFFSDFKNKKIYCLCDPVFLEKFVCSFL